MKQILFLLILITASFTSHATTWVITNTGAQFTPSLITIALGDTILFQLDTLNNAQEVSSATWSSNDSTPVTGFSTPDSGGMVTGLGLGTHYYVSGANAYVGMKGRIVVALPATVNFAPVHDSVDESAGVVPVIITVENPNQDTISFVVSNDLVNSTATNNVDYTFSQTLFTNYGPGTTLDTIYIAVIDDQLIEPTETVVLRLSSFSANVIPGTDSVFTLSVLDNDTLTVSFLGAALSYLESADSAFIGVTLSSPVAGVTSVMVVLDSGSAVKGVNFNCADTTLLTFPAFSTDTLYVPVQILEDTVVTGNLQANFDLVNPTNGARIGISAYTVFIIDDDNTAVTNINWQSAVQLYPNPASSVLNINTTIPLTAVSIMGIDGREVTHAGALHTGTTAIPVSALPAGMYLLQGEAGGSVFHAKFLKGGE